ncbi:MAG TPA: DUF4234 domain-containing protein [Pyrinomonadaceae bacterium]|jgi:hypothetical protein
MIYCTKCGQANDDAARICMSCGASFGGKSGPAPFTTEERASAGSQTAGSRSPWTTPLYEEPAYMEPQTGGIITPGEKRDPLMVLILGLVTCGIYALYWVYKTSSEIRDALGREDINPALDTVLTLVTCYIWLVYLAYKYPQLLLQLQERAGQPRNDISLVSLILAIVGLTPVSLYMIQSELNNVWDASGRK